MNARIEEKLKAALLEDIGKGDVTANLLVPANAKAKAVIVAKVGGVFAGAEVARELFKITDSKTRLRFKIKDGQSFSKNKILIEIQGNARVLLKTERTLLNLLQHLCGIATTTRAFVQKAKGVRILDTRKTTPLWRELEKAAVKAGGGHNHRMGLYDAIFVKENHWKFGNLKKLMELPKNKRGQTPNGPFGSDPFCRGIEIEVRNARELSEALMLNPKVILFDNFSPEALRNAVQVARRCNSKIILEASGGVTLENIEAYAKTGVDQISVGSLTHSVKAIDLSLLIK